MKNTEKTIDRFIGDFFMKMFGSPIFVSLLNMVLSTLRVTVLNNHHTWRGRIFITPTCSSYHHPRVTHIILELVKQKLHD